MTTPYFNRAAALADCACTELKDPARGEEVWEGDCCVWPGANAAWIDCCEGRGQLSVNVVNGLPNPDAPGASGLGGLNKTHRCGIGTQNVLYEVKVLRCAGADSCGCDCREEAASRLLGDIQAILRGVRCCLVQAAQEDDCEDWAITGWRTEGPSGGCVAGIVSVSVQEPFPCCSR